MNPLSYDPSENKIKYTIRREGWSDFLAAMFKENCTDYVIENCTGNKDLLFVTIWQADIKWFENFVACYEQLKMTNRLRIVSLPNRMYEIFNDSLSKQKLHHLVNVILTVYANYDHISEIEILVESFKKYKSEYESDYYPRIIEAYHLAGEIAEFTRSGQYKKELKSGEYHVLSVYETYFKPENERHVHKEYEYLKNKFEDENKRTDQPLEKK